MLPYRTSRAFLLYTAMSALRLRLHLPPAQRFINFAVCCHAARLARSALLRGCVPAKTCCVPPALPWLAGFRTSCSPTAPSPNIHLSGSSYLYCALTCICVSRDRVFARYLTTGLFLITFLAPFFAASKEGITQPLLCLPEQFSVAELSWRAVRTTPYDMPPNPYVLPTPFTTTQAAASAQWLSAS